MFVKTGKSTSLGVVDPKKKQAEQKAKTEDKSKKKQSKGK
jgi:hypothetical protein